MIKSIVHVRKEIRGRNYLVEEGIYPLSKTQTSSSGNGLPSRMNLPAKVGSPEVERRVWVYNSVSGNYNNFYTKGSLVIINSKRSLSKGEVCTVHSLRKNAAGNYLACVISSNTGIYISVRVENLKPYTPKKFYYVAKLSPRMVPVLCNTPPFVTRELARSFMASQGDNLKSGYIILESTDYLREKSLLTTIE